MPLSNDQIASLLGMVNASESDELDCDGCFARVAEFAEAELANREIPDALKAVQTHIRQCTCCKDEYNALLDGLREIEEPG